MADETVKPESLPIGPQPPQPIECVVIDPTSESVAAAVASLELDNAAQVVIAVIPKAQK